MKKSVPELSEAACEESRREILRFIPNYTLE